MDSSGKGKCAEPGRGFFNLLLKTSIDGALAASLGNSICRFTARNVYRMPNWNVINLSELISDLFQYFKYSLKLLLWVSSVFCLCHNSVFPNNGTAYIPISVVKEEEQAVERGGEKKIPLKFLGWKEFCPMNCRSMRWPVWQLQVKSKSRYLHIGQESAPDANQKRNESVCFPTWQTLKVFHRRFN